MTYSRPAIERLIATVGSGLQYGELGPYAGALRDCLAEIDSHGDVMALERAVENALRREGTALNERDAARAEVARLTAVATEIERQRHETALREIELLTVVEAAESWRDAESDDDDAIRMSTLMCSIDAYRASKDRQ
jgi:hypothetical protein